MPLLAQFPCETASSCKRASGHAHAHTHARHAKTHAHAGHPHTHPAHTHAHTAHPHPHSTATTTSSSFTTAFPSTCQQALTKFELKLKNYEPNDLWVVILHDTRAFDVILSPGLFCLLSSSMEAMAVQSHPHLPNTWSSNFHSSLPCIWASSERMDAQR